MHTFEYLRQKCLAPLQWSLSLIIRGCPEESRLAVSPGSQKTNVNFFSREKFAHYTKRKKEKDQYA